MLNLDKLELNKLLRELDYVKSDYEYKSEIIREADTEFLNNVNSILNRSSELESIYKSKVEKKFVSNNTFKVEINEVEKPSKSDKIKKLYREIVKLTHPDKIIQPKLNSLYIEAGNYYEYNDIIGIYKICEYLLIPYEVEISDIDLIKENISILKERITFIENTLTWKWYNVTDESIKNEIALKYIENQIT